MKILSTCLSTLFLICIAALPVRAQAVAPGTGSRQAEGLNIYLDCNRCDSQYIRTEITFVNYVRDRVDADVHLLITDTNTGSGGREYTLNFIGRGRFAAMQDTLRYTASDIATSDERRAGLVGVMKIGLLRYVARTPLAEQISITYEAREGQAETTRTDDPWNYWVFNAGMDGSFEGEETRDFLRVRSNLSANRITEAWKIRFWLNGDYRRSTFELEDTTIVNTTRNGSFFNFIAKSFGSHWSAGSTVFVNTSSFNNTDLLVSVAPAVEYSIFPYSDFTRREFRIEYRIGLRAYDYELPTIFEKTSEKFLYHELEATFELRQPWGTVDFSLDGFHFLHDFETTRTDLYSIDFGGFLNVRLVRGLSVRMGGEISWIRDQVFLPAEETSEEEILLRSRRLPTSYDYEISLGLNYTFGSIYNNIVNPRFGF